MQGVPNGMGVGEREIEMVRWFNSTFDRIDFVYFSTGDGVEVKSATELDGRNSVTAWPSDHRAVLSSFVLGPRR